MVSFLEHLVLFLMKAVYNTLFYREQGKTNAILSEKPSKLSLAFKNAMLACFVVFARLSEELPLVVSYFKKLG